MNKRTPQSDANEDSVLREVWRARDARSAARGHSVEKLFADLRAREKSCGHRLVNLQEPRTKPPKKKPGKHA